MTPSVTRWDELPPDKRDVLEDWPEAKAILQDPTLSPDQRKARMRPVLGKVNEELRELLATQERDLVPLRDKVAALKSIEPWCKSTVYSLERNDCSRLHKLAEAANADKIIVGKGDDAPSHRELMLYFKNAHVFVVEHDWAAAFENATDYHDGEVALPFEHCAFEFRFAGKTVIVIVFQPSPETLSRAGGLKPGGPQWAVPFIECGGGWWWCAGMAARDQPVMQYAWKQIRAISIALDAEVATREIVRAPVALNEKRAKKGAIPLYDYHVVKLHGRTTHGRTPGAGTHRSPRLHFRRGHWRHYETHRTWIKWMLVGNPELGFIDKSYRL